MDRHALKLSRQNHIMRKLDSMETDNKSTTELYKPKQSTDKSPTGLFDDDFNVVEENNKDSVEIPLWAIFVGIAIIIFVVIVIVVFSL